MEEIISLREEVSKSYKSIKGLTYEITGTKSEDWTKVEIKGYVFVEGKGDRPVYHIGSVKRTLVEESVNGKTYKVEYVNDYSDYASATTPFSAHKNACHLCGHAIQDIHYIINYKAKMYMQVGCECVGNNHGEVVRNTIKTFIMNETREKFNELRPKVIAYLSTFYDISEKYAPETNDYAIRNGRLEFWAFNLKKFLEKIVPEETGVKKLKNVIVKMNSVLTDSKPKTIDTNSIKKFARNFLDILKFKEENINDAIVTFGKFKNKTIAEVDSSYIAWIKTL